jgi:hypothetical protein
MIFSRLLVVALLVRFMLGAGLNVSQSCLQKFTISALSVFSALGMIPVLGFVMRWLRVNVRASLCGMLMIPFLCSGISLRLRFFLRLLVWFLGCHFPVILGRQVRFLKLTHTSN